MTDAVGPVFAAGFQTITKSGYELLFLPDLHNDALQREGKAPVYWWMPNATRLATKQNGDYMFSFIHFAGVRSTDTTVGAHSNDEEVAGGLLGFSVTMAPPAGVLQEAQDELLQRFRGNDDHFWGWRTPVTPMFRPMPIVSNTTGVTNLSPGADGGFAAPAGGPAAPAGGGAPPAGGPPPAGGRALNPSAAPPIGLVPASRAFSAPVLRALGSGAARDLGMWAFNLQGQGAGNIDALGINSYSALVGSIPAALIWQSFHEGTSAFSVWQNLKLKVWSPAVHIHMEGDWDRIQTHFSAAAHAGGLFWGADIQAQFNDLRMSGAIHTTIEVDSTLPNADKLSEEIDKRSDLVFQKFMDEAQKVIFDPAPFNEAPAQASGGFLGLGGGAAFKLRQDQTHLHLQYDETREVAYLQDNVVPGQLDGLYDVLKSDPSQEKKYFTNLYLDDWDRKVTRTIKPVVNWPDAAKQWVGQPVAFLSAQVGYPNTDGVVEWDGHVFQQSDGADAIWQARMAMKKESDVSNAPAGWKADHTFLKRQIHFAEPPTDTENPYARVQVEQNVVDLDPGDLGSLVDDVNIEVRVDEAGALSVGPIALGVELEGPTQVVEVTLQAQGKTKDGKDRDPVKFSFNATDQDTPRYWMVFTGDPGFVPKYTYQVRVIVKGSLFAKGQEWLGPVQEMSASGPLMVSVPTPDDAGVTKRELSFTGTRADGTKRTTAPRSAGPPPATAPQTATASQEPVRGSGHGGPPPAGTPGHAREVTPAAGGAGTSGWESRDISPARDLSGWTSAPATPAHA